MSGLHHPKRYAIISKKPASQPKNFQKIWKISQGRADDANQTFFWLLDHKLCLHRLIVINEIHQISQKKLDFAKFRKLQEAIWLTIINEIFKFPSHFDPFGYVNYLHVLSLGYPNYPTQIWYIWTSFQTSRKKFVNYRKPYG